MSVLMALEEWTYHKCFIIKSMQLLAHNGWLQSMAVRPSPISLESILGIFFIVFIGETKTPLQTSHPLAGWFGDHAVRYYPQAQWMVDLELEPVVCRCFQVVSQLHQLESILLFLFSYRSDTLCTLHYWRARTNLYDLSRKCIAR